MQFEILDLGLYPVVSIDRSSGVDTMIAPAADDVRWANNTVQWRHFGFPVVIKIWVLSRSCKRIFNETISPVEEGRITNVFGQPSCAIARGEIRYAYRFWN